MQVKAELMSFHRLHFSIVNLSYVGKFRSTAGSDLLRARSPLSARIISLPVIHPSFAVSFCGPQLIPDRDQTFHVNPPADYRPEAAPSEIVTQVRCRGLATPMRISSFLRSALRSRK